MKVEIKRVSPISGKENVILIEATQEEIDAYYRGELIQRAFPRLTDNEREFILTGITPDEWDKTFKE